MRVTIVTPNDKVEQAREAARGKFPGAALKTPLSASGKAPATHWMCVMHTTDEGFRTLLDMKEHSVIANTSPKVLLEELGLKTIEQK